MREVRMTLRFDGLGAGLGYRSQSGDRNDPVNYTLICAGDCGAELGPLARFRVIPDPTAPVEKRETYEGSNRDEGYRFVRCGRCGRGILVRGTQVVQVLTRQELELREAQVRGLVAATATKHCAECHADFAPTVGHVCRPSLMPGDACARCAGGESCE